MYAIRTMTLADYHGVINLMQQTPGITFRDADSHENTARYLARNQGLSFIAMVNDALIGCLMAGHDGRRGYLQHLIVRPDFRRRGVGAALVERCLVALEAEGIHKSHIDVQVSNEAAAAFWEAQGWRVRTDIKRYSFVRSGGANA